MAVKPKDPPAEFDVLAGVLARVRRGDGSATDRELVSGLRDWEIEAVDTYTKQMRADEARVARDLRTRGQEAREFYSAVVQQHPTAARYIAGPLREVSVAANMLRGAQRESHREQAGHRRTRSTRAGPSSDDDLPAERWESFAAIDRLMRSNRGLA
jgi:hypothetical protein